MMSWVWGILFCLGAGITTFTKGGDAAMAAMISGAEEAVTLCLSMAGAYMLYMGLLGVARRAGLIDSLSRALKGACAWMFPGAGEATGPITLNIAANILGLGNAATPFGLEAMRLMQKANKHPAIATNAMCAFLAVNASALQVIPTTLIALRAAAGSMQPAVIVLPAFLASLAATVVAVVACKLCMRER